MSELANLLVDARTQVRLSQAELARRAHVSLPAVKAYEQGKRHPTRPYLTALLDAMKLERVARLTILEAAGYASDGDGIGLAPDDLAMGLEAVSAEVERVAWPAFVLNEMAELVCANTLCQQLWGVDLRVEFTEMPERSMVGVASDRRFASRLANWDAAVGALVSVFKGHHRGPETLDEPSPVFKVMIDRLLKGDPEYVERFMKLWQTVEPREPELRWHYPIVWEEPGCGTMRFDAIVNNANFDKGWAFNDWMPVDAETWAGLERLKQLRR